MKKIAQGIVRLRKLILTVAVLLLIPSAIGAIATRINYDILTYLPQDLDSMIGEVALEDDFHLASTGMITVEGLPTNELIAMKKEIEAVPGVTQTFWLSDVIDPNIPTAMLPADVQQFMFGKNDSTMLIVRFDAPSASDETLEAVKQIEKLLRKDCFFGGMSVILQDTKALVNQEMPLYILIAVGASLLVLFLSLESTITPLLFMLGLLFPIAYNFGTNIFLGQISYITEALATVLQLGVTMDFSIFLLHRYQEEKELRSTNEEAMVSAICKTMTSISASSLTTIAGFLALCAMRLTLGRDIGLVMAKGVALGVICTVVILPALILTFDKWVEKYKHRTVIPRLTKLSYFVSKHSVPIVAVFILILIPFAIAQNKTSVYYTLFDSLPQDLTGIVGTNKLGEDFGMTTSHFILVHDDLTATQVSDLCDELKDVDGITDGSMAGVFTNMPIGYPPCTAQACLEILKFYNIPLSGRRAVVVGRSLVVGKPAAMMLDRENATVTICNSRTQNLPAICKEADVEVEAMGKMGAVGTDCLREGQTVVDVGIHVNEKGKLCGDVKFSEAEPVVDAITPVPGGVGTVTTSVLVGHVVQAAAKKAGL